MSDSLPEWATKSGRGDNQLDLGTIDHYTLIVENAEAVAKFHVEYLGFRLKGVQALNIGSAPEGHHDMLNYILELPSDASKVMVVTEGLTEDSIFQRYMKKYGPGVHHVAYIVTDIEGALAQLKEAGIETTSDELLTDPLTGLRQIFIGREQPGYFIELIERTETAADGTFIDDNMAGLANTMDRYLGD